MPNEPDYVMDESDDPHEEVGDGETVEHVNHVGSEKHVYVDGPYREECEDEDCDGGPFATEAEYHGHLSSHSDGDE